MSSINSWLSPIFFAVSVCVPLTAVSADGSAQDSVPKIGAKSPLELMHQGTARDALYDIAFSGSNGVAVGNHGLLLITTDSGETWETASQQDLPPMTAVAVSGQKAIAVGIMGQIMRSENFAAESDWLPVSSTTQERILSVEMTSTGKAVAVGGLGILLISDDFGETWRDAKLDWETMHPDGIEAHLYGISFMSDRHIIVSGEFGLILDSQDGGETWEVLRMGDESIFSIQINGDGIGYAAGQSGLLLATKDAGRTWSKELLENTGSHLLSVWFNEEVVIATGIRSLAYQRIGESKWHAVHSDWISASWYQSIASTDSLSSKNQAMFVGQAGRVLKFNTNILTAQRTELEKQQYTYVSNKKEATE